MSVNKISAAEAAAAIDQFDAVIDARSESEFALDSLPHAVNWPTLNDAQREAVGTQYKQVSAFDARKQGAAMAARNIAAHIERESPNLARGWKPLIYCWRGGQRSGALGLVLGQIGFDVQVLDGGYRAFRRHLVDDMDGQVARLQFQMLCGKTGSAKSRLLGALNEAGAQVLDLEGLACHRGSVLGALPGQPQPSQKRFETLVWDALRQFDADRPVFVESESRTVGRLRVPEPLLLAMRAAPCKVLDMPLAARVELLMQDYAHFLTDTESLCERLAVLREARGAAVVDAWQALARQGQWAAVVQELLIDHYDPIYLRSMGRNFQQFASAQTCALEDGSPAVLAAAAQTLMQQRPGPRNP